jgi:TPR repeat protein
MYNLAVIYSEGRGIAADGQESFKWFLKAAQKGFAQAQYNLGLIYADGLGVLQNEKEAFRWFSLAADQGHAAAKCCLAEMYASGLGVSKNLSKMKQLAMEGFDAGEELCRFVLEKHKTAVVK